MKYAFSILFLVFSLDCLATSVCIVTRGNMISASIGTIKISCSGEQSYNVPSNTPSATDSEVATELNKLIESGYKIISQTNESYTLIKY